MVVELARDGQRDVETTGPDCQHAERPCSRRMTIGSQQALTRFSEPLHVHDMADPVARRRIPDSEPAAGAFEKQMIVGIAVVYLKLKQIVIDVLHAHFRPRAIEPERFQRKHRQRSRRVLGERLIHLQ
jgi:hypothetical protein